jgi:predicted esterase
MHRRSFLTKGLTLGAVGAADLLRRSRTAFAQAPAQDPERIPYGETRMRLNNDERQGTVYIPKAYKHGTPRPLLVMLHGLMGTSEGARAWHPLAEELGIILIAPESRQETWGAGAPGFDPDSKYIAQAFNAVTDFCDVEPARVGIGGISDGATYAISMGLAFGDRFTRIMVFSEGIPYPFRKQGKPKLFIGHGINDEQMPIDRTSRRSVPQLREEGYDVTYREYEGGHGPPRAIIREGFEWLAKG